MFVYPISNLIYRFPKTRIDDAFFSGIFTLTTSQILKEILRLAIPAMLALASTPLLSIGETAMIGRLGAEPLAARAIGAALTGAIYWVFAFLTFGSTTLIGHHYGAGDVKACGETYLHGLFLAVIGGAAIAAVCIVFAPELYRLMGADDKVAELGARYFRVYIAGAPCTLIMLASVGFFRGVQNTRTPMVLAFFTNGLQLILGYGLIYGHFGLPRLELLGAAVAAVIAQSAGALTYVGSFFLGRETAPYRQISSQICKERLVPLFRIGQDLAIRTGALRGSLVFATATAARMGAVTLSAYEIAFQLFMLCSEVIDGLAVAGQALVAKYLGSGQRSTAFRMGKIVTACGAVVGVGFALFFLATREPILQFFTSSTQVHATLTFELFVLVGLMQPFNGIVFVLDGLLIGAKDTRYLMWAMLAGGLGLFVPIAWLSLRQGWGLTGLLIGISALMAWRLLTNGYRFGTWRRSA